MKRPSAESLKDLSKEQLIDLVLELLERVEKLSEQNAALMAQNAALMKRVEVLEGQLKKNSRNSSKPPSSDGPKKPKRTKSLRQPSERRMGGQLGHAGKTLEMAAQADEVVVHTPEICPKCGEKVSLEALEVVKRGQVFDLPPVNLRVTEHRVMGCRCGRCGAKVSADLPAGVRHGAQYGPRVKSWIVYLQQSQFLPLKRLSRLLSELLGQPISQATMIKMGQDAADKLVQIEQRTRDELAQSEVLHVDETSLRVDGKLMWCHVTCNKEQTSYHLSAHRGQEAIREAGLIGRFFGWLIHDGLKVYQAYTQCYHGLCGAHLLRELVYLAEERGQIWAKELIELLLEMKAAADEARDQGLEQLEWARRTALEQRYKALLLQGEALHPPAELAGRKRPRQSEERRLLSRLDQYQHQVLAFIKDLRVPFDNNQAERDLRMVKVRQKVSGCFRTTLGALIFLRLRGYLSTMNKQNRHLLDALQAIFSPSPARSG